MMFGGARLDAGMFTSAMNEVLDRYDAPFSPDFSVRPNGADHWWGKDPRK